MNDSVVVIGSGPSGATAALVLLSKGMPVTLVESGQNPPTGLLVRAMGRNIYRNKGNQSGSESKISFNPLADPKTRWFYALEPGGLSNYWTGAVPRFAAEDFFEGERLHECHRWPVTYEDLVPYYEEVEKLLTVTADPQNLPNLPASTVAYKKQLPAEWKKIAAHAKSFDQGLTTIPLADGPPWLITRTGTYFNSFTRIIQILHKFQDFKLILGAHVTQMEWSGTTKKVEAINYIDRATRTEQRLTGAAFVVAAGPIATARIMLASTSSDFPDGLGNTEGVLGRFLHDHPNSWFEISLEKALPRLSHAAYLTRKSYKDSEPLLAASCTIGSAGTGHKFDKALSFTPVKDNAFGVNVFGTMIPTRDNYIQLNPVIKDEFDLPGLDINIRYDKKELAATIEAKERLLTILESAGYSCKAQDIYFKSPGSAAHYGGTVRMHSSPKYGMLNGWNRLHSVNNVAVVDASSFTTGVEKNPTLTAMALAARASTKLAADLKKNNL